MCDTQDNTANLDYLRRQENEEDVYVDPPPANKCHIKIDLRGPFSPLETQIHAATQIGKYKKIIIENQSVNSVLLDSDPQNSNEKLLVAASVTQNPNRGEMCARSTTLMPSIPGFPALMALIFCPTVEMKRDANNSKYIGMLAGLGCDDEKKPIFEEHDMVFNFDVEIAPDDLEMINQLRYTMDLLVYTSRDQTVPQIDHKAKKALPPKIKNLIVGLLEKPRKRIEVQRSRKDHLWNQYDEGDVLQVKTTFDRAIFPLHFGLRCYKESFERMQTLRIHCSELYKLGRFEIPIKPVLCQLCGETLENATQLRIHLLSQLHRDREHQIGYTK